MKLFLKLQDIYENIGHINLSRVIDFYGKKNYTYFLLPHNDYMLILNSLHEGVKNELIFSQTKEFFPMFNYRGFIFQWIPKEKEDSLNIIA